MSEAPEIWSAIASWVGGLGTVGGIAVAIYLSRRDHSAREADRLSAAKATAMQRVENVDAARIVLRQALAMLTDTITAWAAGDKDYATMKPHDGFNLLVAHMLQIAQSPLPAGTSPCVLAITDQIKRAEISTRALFDERTNQVTRERHLALLRQLAEEMSQFLRLIQKGDWTGAAATSATRFDGR